MSTQVLLTIPDEIYRRAEQLAWTHNRSVDEVLVESIQLPVSDDVIDLSEPDEAVEREMHAYKALHPSLWQQYPKQHVAIYGGQLVDRDDDLEQLCQRIYEKYPNEFVWITKVEEEPLRISYNPSIRFLTEEN